MEQVFTFILDSLTKVFKFMSDTEIGGLNMMQYSLAIMVTAFTFRFARLGKPNLQAIDKSYKK